MTIFDNPVKAFKEFEIIKETLQEVINEAGTGDKIENTFPEFMMAFDILGAEYARLTTE